MPLIFDGNFEYEIAKLDKINGIIFPGDGNDTYTLEYKKFSKAVYEKVVKLNEKYVRTPIFAINSGF